MTGFVQRGISLNFTSNARNCKRVRRRSRCGVRMLAFAVFCRPAMMTLRVFNAAQRCKMSYAGRLSSMLCVRIERPRKAKASFRIYEKKLFTRSVVRARLLAQGGPILHASIRGLIASCSHMVELASFTPAVCVRPCDSSRSLLRRVLGRFLPSGRCRHNNGFQSVLLQS